MFILAFINIYEWERGHFNVKEHYIGQTCDAVPEAWDMS